MLGSGPFPQGPTEVEVAPPPSLLPLQPDVPSADAKPSSSWVLYGDFWSASNGEDPEDEDSDNIPWEFDVSHAVGPSVKRAGVTMTLREARMTKFQLQKEEVKKKVDEAVWLLSKANNGDMEAKAEVI
jgi:hypothetical protein